MLTHFQQALTLEKPLQIVGAINAYTAMLAKRAEFHAIYLSGAGVANASFGVSDAGITTLENVLEDARRITHAVDLPLLVDIDTGWENIAKTIKEMIKANVSAVHIEDQTKNKRCGHLEGKTIVSISTMVDRIKAAVDARNNPNFVIMARTDALANEGLEATLDRIQHYVAAGADMIFFEGARKLSEYQALTQICKVPVLANITEFGVTPLFSVSELKNVGVSLILYPLSAFRTMSQAAMNTYQTIRKTGTQKTLIDSMQTRDELYNVLNYDS